MRVVVSYFGCKARDIGRADIGRIGHDEVECVRQRGGVIAGDKRRARWASFSSVGVAAARSAMPPG